MNKILRYSFIIVMALITTAANAGKITFGSLNLTNQQQYTEPFDGGDFTVTFSGGTNDGKYYTTGSGIRVYGDGKMTIKAKSGTLTKIGITYDGTYKPESANVVNVGTYNVSSGIWTGNASEVVFTRPTGSGHWRVQVVATGSDVEDNTPTEGQTASAPITVTRALEIINALTDGATANGTYYVKGVVTNIEEVSAQYGNATFSIGDAAGATATVKAFRLKGLGNKNVTRADLLKVGDEVVLCGALQKYVSNDGTMTPEVINGYIYSINGQTEDTAPNPEDAVTKGTDAASPMTVAEALAYINAFTDGFTTTKQYYVQGTVSTVTEISTSNGTATFTMDGLTVFRVKGLDNKNIASDDYVKAGDNVVVYAKLQKYVQDGTTTPELSTGYIYSLNGKTQEDVQLTGDGTKANPYLVSDLRQLSESNYPAEAVWVKGVIVGSANSATALKGDTENVNSNIAIATAASSTEFVPVELKNNTEFRTKLNLVDNASNKGKEVLLKGKILKYFSTTGVKELEEAILDGQTITGIATITVGDVNAPLYNLAGQKVNAGFKGLVIKNGRKFIQK